MWQVKLPAFDEAYFYLIVYYVDTHSRACILGTRSQGAEGYGQIESQYFNSDTGLQSEQWDLL